MKTNSALRRKQRIRTKISVTSTDRPRLSVHKTNLHIYAQVIDDKNAVTVAAASSLTADFKEQLKGGGNKAAAKLVGDMIAKKALAKGVHKVVFDRSGWIYHGRIQELAEAARQGGLSF